MDGQMTIFDLGIETDTRPCRYKFHRYVGQRVKSSHGIGTVTEIASEYYTYVRTDGGETLCLTPYDMHPLEEVKRCCENCDRYVTIVEGYSCEPIGKVCHRPGTVYGDTITYPESHVCECWEERTTDDE